MARRALVVAGAIVALASPARAQQPSTYEELQSFSSVLNYVRLNYVDPVSYHRLVRAAIDGMLQALDPHSRFESAEDVAREVQIEDGQLAGIGVMLEDVAGVPTVLAVVPKGPAERKDVQPGDRLRAINDTTVEGLEVDDLALKLWGPKGSKITLTLERGPVLEPDTFRITLKRDRLESRSVYLQKLLAPNTGYVHLVEFRESAAKEVADAINDLMHRGARQIILDLRGNPGGIVDASVEVASLFFPRHTLIFRTRGRKADIDQDFITKHDGAFRDVPLIVLVDERSASAAEALAASLQDHDRAVLIGRRTFGKALEQSVFLLPGGDRVWLTVGRVLTPSGRFIQRRYRGLGEAQYESFAGRSGAEEDTLATYRTDDGRVVRGGGGIVPDIVLPAPTPLPAWFTVAADSGVVDAVADSVAFRMSAADSARQSWTSNPERWDRDLLAPFLERVRGRLHVRAEADSAIAARIARRLAYRVVEVRWGENAASDFALHLDPGVREALARFPDLPRLLAPGSN